MVASTRLREAHKARRAWGGWKEPAAGTDSKGGGEKEDKGGGKKKEKKNNNNKKKKKKKKKKKNNKNRRRRRTTWRRTTTTTTTTRTSSRSACHDPRTAQGDALPRRGSSPSYPLGDPLGDAPGDALGQESIKTNKAKAPTPSSTTTGDPVRHNQLSQITAAQRHDTSTRARALLEILLLETKKDCLREAMLIAGCPGAVLPVRCPSLPVDASPTTPG
ncbi:unnamed protein product [Diplocarpon coronariae]